MRVVVCVSVAGLLFSVLSIDAMHRVKKIVGQMQGRSDSVVKADRRGTKDIWDAIERGYVEAVKYWLDQGVNKEAKDENGWTPLIAAAYLGQLDVVKYLVEQGADKEAKDRIGWTSLMTAANLGHLDVVKYLVEQGADKEAKDSVGWTSLRAASFAGHLDVVKYLVEHRANKEAKDNNGWAPLIAASSAGQLKIVKYLVEHRANKEAKDNRGVTPLIAASSAGELKVVKYLVKHGADKEAKDNKGWTSLMAAAYSGQLDVVRYLVEHRANKEAKDNVGWTPLIVAASAGELKVVKYLVEHRANEEAKDNKGWTPLIAASSAGRLDIVKYLVKHGADKEAKDNKGWTPLIAASLAGRSDIVKYLVEQGVVIDESLAEKLIEVLLADTDKNFYLLLAGKGYSSDHPAYGQELRKLLLGGNIKKVEFLIEIGVDPYQVDDEGLNAFDYAQDNPELMAILNKTKHKAIEKQEIAEQESDTQKALRRLQHIRRAMQPEVPTPSSKEMKDIVVPEGLLPTEAHWKLFGAEIEKEYGKVLDNLLVKRILAREKEAIAQGKYVFYRSEPGKYRVYQDFLQELYKLVNLYSKENRFVLNRFFKDAATQKTINEYIDTMQSRAHKTGAEFNVLLSANISLFGNVRNPGSCTWDYFLKNYEATGAVTLPDMFKRIFDQYGFDHTYINKLLALHQGILEQYATLQQIIIPKNIVNDVVMFATHGYCFPWQEQVDQGQADSCWDPNAISVDLKGNPKKGRYTCISSIIDKYRDGRIAIDDAYQVRILMNAVYGLNPESGIEIYQYTRLPEKKLLHFKKQVQKITDEMFGEWLKEQLSKKEVPESVKGEKLGDVLQYLGKGRKEPVKSKL